jgi:RHS repeat-associated protein
LGKNVYKSVGKSNGTAYHREGDLYWADYGFGTVRPGGDGGEDAPYQRRYQWNERNLLSESSDRSHTVQYRYGADGQRALKFVANGGRTTAYFNKMWQMSDAVGAEWLQGKHVYVGEDRIATKYSTEGNDNTQAEERRVYYYHSDHLGSAQTVTNFQGQVHERLEYTPYGELWIDWSSREAPQDGTPFRFTGKELDAETGLYYYGARYLDPKTSRWISSDPAVGDYIPQAGGGGSGLPGMGGVYNPVNLHTYHYAFNNPIRYIDPIGREGEESEGTLTVSGQLNELKEYVARYNTGNTSPQTKADAAWKLRRDIDNNVYDIENLIYSDEGNEQFMNEDLRNFLNTSDDGLGYRIGDMNRAGGWREWVLFGKDEHQNNTYPGVRNRKFTNDNDGREAVFRWTGREWVVQNHLLDKGTYNYGRDNKFSANSDHGRWDMAPYFRQHDMGTRSYRPGEVFLRANYNRNGRTNGTGHNGL